MRARATGWVLVGLLASGTMPAGAGAQITSDVPARRPQAIIDLATEQGVRLVDGEWRYSDARVIEVGHRMAGADLRPSGSPTRTYDIEPHAGAADFDDSGWEVLPAAALEGRLSTGKLCFNWYRINVRIPERIGSFDPTGSTVVFEIVVDDYSEVWVDGTLPSVLGQTGGGLIKGYNAPNRVVVARDVRPGQRFQLAVFGVNGPMSSPPGNFIWVRSATLDFHRPEHVGRARVVPTEIVRLDPALDAIVPRDARLEKLADGFASTDGPVWVREGYLLFSDPDDNAIYRWAPDGQVSVFRTKSGYTGVDIGEYARPGSSGLTLDREGRLTITEHGNRRITRLEKNGVVTVLADRYEGKRFNSPSDLVYRSDGALYFTDPPFGLPGLAADPRRELPSSGVYRLRDGRVELLTAALAGPRGMAFSPDERYLYVSDGDPARKVVMRYAIGGDGALATGEVFLDLTGEPGQEALDGLKVDQAGNVYLAGPGGLWIVAPDGTPLGTIRGPEPPTNFAWGDTDGRTLYLTARTGLYRLRLNVAGVRP
jgi:gluconolactonase